MYIPTHLPTTAGCLVLRTFGFSSFPILATKGGMGSNELMEEAIHQLGGVTGYPLQYRVAFGSDDG